MPILETHSAQFLKVLEAGSVATNVFLRRLHNFALDRSWLPWPVLAHRHFASPAITGSSMKLAFCGVRQMRWVALTKLSGLAYMMFGT